MPSNPELGQRTFGLLPEPERRPGSFIISAIINAVILSLVLVLGVVAKHDLDKRQFEQTQLVLPEPPPPPPPVIKIKMPPPPPVEMPKPLLPEVKLEQQKINIPKPELKPEPKPVLKMEAKLTPLSPLKLAKPQIVLAPQPKNAMAKAAMPSLTLQAHPSIAPVHLGSLVGVTPNPHASGKPATIAAIGNPYGGMSGPAKAPNGVVGSTGFGGSTRSGSTAGIAGKVASAGIPGGTGTAIHGAPGGYGGRSVAAVAMPAMKQAPSPAALPTYQAPTTTSIELTYKPIPEYTAEARQMRIQGDVVLKVTFTSNGEVRVLGLVHGLGHGLDEQAMRTVKLYRFTPATRNGQPVDLTTNIHITFQLA